MKQNSIRLLVFATIIGLVVGVIFIFLQPLFGMSALTQRHAEGYLKLDTTMSGQSALISAWSIHLFISACYGVASAVALMINRHVFVYSLQILFLSWITTVIAPPANAFLIKFIGAKSIPSLSALPAMNFQLDAKFMLHLIFFAVIAITIWYRQRRLSHK